MASPRFQQIERSINLAIEGTKRQIQERLVQIAKSEHRKVMEADPKPLSFSRLVDGKLGAPEEAVSPKGIIIYRYPRFELIAQYALERLRKHSPVGIPPDDKHPGLYRDSHTVFINDVQTNDFSKWTEGSEVVIANFVPYARVIELAKWSNDRPFKVRVPDTDKVYWRAQQDVQKEYGEFANIRFTFRGIAGGALINRSTSHDSDDRYPALVISDKTGPGR